MVTDGIDGLLCEPDDVDDLTHAIERLYRPGQLAALRAAVRPADTEDSWREYLTRLFGLLARPPGGQPRGASATGEDSATNGESNLTAALPRQA
jgi:hypothetical protein